MVNRIALTLVFTLSFLTYLMPELNVSLQLAPLILFAVLVYFRVFWSHQILRAVGSLFELDGLLFVIFLSLLIVGPSIESKFDKSLEFALLISVCLILARLYMAVVPISEILEAFFWSGIVSIGLFTLLTFSSLVQSIRTLERFSPFSFHPNLLGFLAAGYFCAMVWKFMTAARPMKILAGLVGLICLLIVFFTSSRGSILGMVCGCVAVGGMSIARARKEGRIRLRRVALACGVLLLGFLLFHQSFAWTEDLYSFVDKALAITDSYRGVDSGFTGRFDKWHATLNLLSDGTWLTGKGVRSSDSMQDNLIDNSYLVLVYELGLVPLILIMWRFVRILQRVVKSYFCSIDMEQRRLCLACSLLMVAFLVNNIVARYLFGVGNPYSLLAFFFFVAPIERFVPKLAQSTGERKLPKCVVRLPASNLQPSS